MSFWSVVEGRLKEETTMRSDMAPAEKAKNFMTAGLVSGLCIGFAVGVFLTAIICGA